MKKSCDTCKHYSRLRVVPGEWAECCYCQAHHCIYCEHHGVNCKDYESGENDGGKHIEDEDEDE